MICDKCGYNMTSGVRCPNCYHDNSNTDYTPDEIEYFIDGSVVTTDSKDKKRAKKGHESSPGKEIPLHCISADLFEYAHFARQFSVITFIIIAFYMSIILIISKSMWVSLLPAHIPILVFFLMDIILSSLILRGKEWVLVAYIPFMIITFPLLFIWELLSKRFEFVQTKILLSSRFFINDFRHYLAYRREEKERKETR